MPSYKVSLLKSGSLSLDLSYIAHYQDGIEPAWRLVTILSSLNFRRSTIQIAMALRGKSNNHAPAFSLGGFSN